VQIKTYLECVKQNNFEEKQMKLKSKQGICIWGWGVVYLYFKMRLCSCNKNLGYLLNFWGKLASNAIYLRLRKKVILQKSKRSMSRVGLLLHLILCSSSANGKKIKPSSIQINTKMNRQI